MNQKKKVHFVHSQKIENWETLYKILRKSKKLENLEIFLPHETNVVFNTKKMIKEADLIIAECSEITPGIAIELAWADAFEKNIVGFVKESTDVSGYLNFFEFKTHKYLEDLEIVEFLENLRE